MQVQIRPVKELGAVSLFVLHMRTCRAITLKKQLSMAPLGTWEDGDLSVCPCHDIVTRHGAGTMGIQPLYQSNGGSTFNEQGLPTHRPLGSVLSNQ
jgi:hypothetical protein